MCCVKKKKKPQISSEVLLNQIATYIISDGFIVMMDCPVNPISKSIEQIYIVNSRVYRVVHAIDTLLLY